MLERLILNTNIQLGEMSMWRRMSVRKEQMQLSLIHAFALHPVIGGEQGTSAVISSPGCSLVRVLTNKINHITRVLLVYLN